MDRIGWRRERRVWFYSRHPMNPIYPSSKEGDDHCVTACDAGLIDFSVPRDDRVDSWVSLGCVRTTLRRRQRLNALFLN